MNPGILCACGDYFPRRPGRGRQKDCCPACEAKRDAAYRQRERERWAKRGAGDIRHHGRPRVAVQTELTDAHPTDVGAISIYTDEQEAWIRACRRYQEESGLKFLKATDYLRVAGELGYAKLPVPA